MDDQDPLLVKDQSGRVFYRVNDRAFIHIMCSHHQTPGFVVGASRPSLQVLLLNASQSGLLCFAAGFAIGRVAIRFVVRCCQVPIAHFLAFLARSGFDVDLAFSCHNFCT